jgi:8-oxo-dGTP diphosphatase
MSTRLKMVVGLHFDLSRQFVAMVHKLSGPACVIGNWNGVGGKCEPGEDPLHAMVREFGEETGLATHLQDWHQFAELNATNYDLFFFHAASSAVFQCKTMEKEPIKVWKAVDLLGESNVMHNMRWMIPYLQDADMIPHNLGTLSIRR